VDLANLGSESETCVGSRVRLVGVFISFEKNFYRLPITPPPLVCCIGPSKREKMLYIDDKAKIVVKLIEDWWHVINFVPDHNHGLVLKPSLKSS
jgi:hypothetical protein